MYITKAIVFHIIYGIKRLFIRFLNFFRYISRLKTSILRKKRKPEMKKKVGTATLHIIFDIKCVIK